MIMIIVTTDTDYRPSAPHASKHSKWMTCFYWPHDSVHELHFTDEEVEAQRD